MHRDVAGTGLSYEMVSFDRHGVEVAEDGGLVSDALVATVSDPAAPITDVFVVVHGWQADLAGAIQSYDSWLGAMGKVLEDAPRPDVHPLIIGVHWPSKAFVDDDLAVPPDEIADRYATTIAPSQSPGTTARTRAAVRAALDPANYGEDGKPRDDRVDAAFRQLAVDADVVPESGLMRLAPYETWAATVVAAAASPAAGTAAAGPAASPAAGTAAASPTAGTAAASPAAAQGLSPHALGPGAVLDVLRQFSFWTMRERARSLGQGAFADLLRRLTAAAPATTRFHLMGHSFGCIVTSSAVAGLSGAPGRSTIDTLFLVQGAVAIWAYDDVEPFLGSRGPFHDVVTERTTGAVVVTTSSDDHAIGTYFPLAALIEVDGGAFAQAGSQAAPAAARQNYPRHGGLGAFGIQGWTHTEATLGDGTPIFKGTVVDVDCSAVISTGPPPAGAHSDIAHPEIAELFLQAVDASA